MHALGKVTNRFNGAESAWSRMRQMLKYDALAFNGTNYSITFEKRLSLVSGGDRAHLQYWNCPWSLAIGLE